MKVELDVLRGALERLLDHTEQMKGKSVEVEDDYYWFIPREELHDPTKAPTTMSLGSLEEDWANLVALAQGDKEAFGYMLVWASAVLRALGDRTM
jgi:hypothetical protein